MSIYIRDNSAAMGSTSLPQATATNDFRPITDPDDPINPANNVNRLVYGWSALARIMDDVPRLQSFASFSDLTIKSLLYYQAELSYLRKRLHEAEWQDYRRPDIELSPSFASDLRFLIEARDDSIASAGALPEQWVLIERIRTTLDKYSKTNSPQREGWLIQPFPKILHYCNLQRWQTSQSRTLQMFQCYWSVRRAGRGRDPIAGDGAYTWGNYNEIPERKSLIELFLGLFTGIFISPAADLKSTAFAFKEHLITIRPPDSGHT